MCADPAWSSHSNVWTRPSNVHRDAGPKQNKRVSGNKSVNPGFSAATQSSARTPISIGKEPHSPEMSFYGMKALCEPPRWPTTPSIFVQGEPWSWALCLPARIPGSQVGVARQPHHSALGCFAFGVKRDPQMSRHCHSSNLSPKEFLEVDHKRVFLECYAIPCQGLQDSNISLNLGICFHGLRF